VKSIKKKGLLVVKIIGIGVIIIFRQVGILIPKKLKRVLNGVLNVWEVRKIEIMKIPLYNCYWCRCGWCLNRAECLDHCIRCIMQKKFRMPEYCENFIEDSRTNRRIKARNMECEYCQYKIMLQELKDKIKNLFNEVKL
jgi:hypothetical protein